MANLATFNVPLDGLRQLMGLPESVRIVRCHALPNQFAGGEDCLRFVIESPDLPATPDGEEIPFVVPRYELNADTYRKFKGFRTVRLTVQEAAGVSDDHL